MTKKRELDEVEQRNKKIALRLAVFFACLLLVNFLIYSIVYTWSDWIALLLFSLLFIVPAYISNASMVVTGGGKPIDGGRNFTDGRRLFGDHKTWNGLIKGPLYIGIPVSLGIFLLFVGLWSFIEVFIVESINNGVYSLYDYIGIYQYYFTGGVFPISLLVLILRIFICAYGAAIGDLIGSFLKRRFDISSGQPFWVVDQLDFCLIAILLTFIPSLIAPNLFIPPDIHVIIFLLILTPSVSVIANTVAYVTGLKEVPW